MGGYDELLIWPTLVTAIWAAVQEAAIGPSDDDGVTVSAGQWPFMADQGKLCKGTAWKGASWQS